MVGVWYRINDIHVLNDHLNLLPLSCPAPDKKAGVTAIVLFDMRRRGKVGRILLCDAVGTRMPAARATMKEKIGDVYAGMDLTLECFPGDDVPWDPDAYKQAMDTMVPGRLLERL